MAILEDEECEERKAFRTAHLKELMYLSSRFEWRCVLDYHGSSFQLLQSTTLAGGFLAQNSRGSGSGGGFNRSGTIANRTNEGTVFCKGFNRGTCQQPRDHYGHFMGKNRLLKHICGNCWIISKTQATHAETSEECPLKGLQQL